MLDTYLLASMFLFGPHNYHPVFGPLLEIFHVINISNAISDVLARKCEYTHDWTLVARCWATRLFNENVIYQSTGYFVHLYLPWKKRGKKSFGSHLPSEGVPYLSWDVPASQLFDANFACDFWIVYRTMNQLNRSNTVCIKYRMPNWPFGKKSGLNSLPVLTQVLACAQ